MDTGEGGRSGPNVTFSVTMGKGKDTGCVTTLCQNMAARIALEKARKRACAHLEDATLVSIGFFNKPFYSCLLSDPAYEWQRGCRLYGPRCFYHVNYVVVMRTSLHLHKNSKEVCITGSLAAIHRPGH